VPSPHPHVEFSSRRCVRKDLATSSDPMFHSVDRGSHQRKFADLPRAWCAKAPRSRTARYLIEKFQNLADRSPLLKHRSMPHASSPCFAKPQKTLPLVKKLRSKLKAYALCHAAVESGAVLGVAQLPPVYKLCNRMFGLSAAVFSGDAGRGMTLIAV
jgi:hypothetical protein